MMRFSRGGARIETAIVPMAVMLLIFVVSYGAVVLTRHGHTITPFWPGTAIALCAMLRWADTKFRRIAIVIGAAVAIGAANYASGKVGWLPIVFSSLNIIELLIASFIADRWAPKTFATPAAGWVFLLKVGATPPVLGAGLACLATFVAGRPDPAAAGLHWYMGHLLGFLLVGPFGMTVSHRSIKRLRLKSRIIEAVAVGAFVLISALAVFGQTHMPLLFMTLPSMLLATFRFRLVGAGVSALLVALVAVPFTSLGLGPIALAPVHPDFLRLFVLQLFLSTSALVCIPVASVLNDRDRKDGLVQAQRLEALAASRAKSELLAHVSHDVRSPLTAIIGFAGLLKQGSVSPEQTARFASLIIKNAEFLTALSDDLLEMAKAEAGVLIIRSEAVAMREALDHLQTTFSSYKALNVSLVAVDDLVVIADAHRLVQVMNNLTSNALKYGAEFGPVTVEAFRLNTSTARILVTNRGPGISEQRRTELFKPFSRLGAESGNIAGTGLGLSITKHLVELQGGQIDMSSVPDQETKFWVDLPLVQVVVPQVLIDAPISVSARNAAAA